VIDAWRRRSRRATSSFSDQALEVEALPDAGRSPHEDLERRKTSTVRRALDTLPEDQREVVVAQAIDGESFISISTRTGVPVATLAARKRRAVKRLAEYLDDDRQ
jgi:RNA polymerase sigma-70 factor (ECF subfamily)